MVIRQPMTFFLSSEDGWWEMEGAWNQSKVNRQRALADSLPIRGSVGYRPKPSRYSFFLPSVFTFGIHLRYSPSVFTFGKKISWGVGLGQPKEVFLTMDGSTGDYTPAILEGIAESIDQVPKNKTGP